MRGVKRALLDEFDQSDEADLETVPQEARTVLARLCDAFVEEGHQVQEFSLLCEKAGYNVAESTLRRWRSNVRSSGGALLGGEGLGRPPALTEQQERLLVGFVIWRNNNNLIVQLETAHKFVQEELNVPIASSTVHDYLMRNGFSSRKCKTKT